MIPLLNTLCFIWLGFWALHGIGRIIRGQYHSVTFLLVVLFVFNGLPLALDVVVGTPDYLRQPGFAISGHDDATSVLYCVYMGFIPILWWAFGRSRVVPVSFSSPDYLSPYPRTGLHWLMRIGLVAPIIAALLAPDPGIYLSYAWVLTAESISTEVIDYHSIVSLLTLLSPLCASILVLSTKRLHLVELLFVSVFITGAIWLNGKRFIIALVAILLWYVLLRKGTIRRFDIFVGGVFAGIMFITISIAYQESLRGITLQDYDTQKAYENYRIDYGRDGVIKQTLYAEMNPDRMRILDYRGQSIVFYLTLYIPRELWPEKPFPYATYPTATMLGIDPRMLGWGITTSWLEEAVANFSWFGLVVGPLLPAIICRIGDQHAGLVVSTVTVVMASLFLVVHFAAFAPLGFLWLLAIMVSRPKRQHLDSGKPRSSQSLFNH